MKAQSRIAGLRNERVRASRQHDGSVFKNPTGLGPGLQGSPLPLLGEYFFGDAKRNPPRPLPVERPHEAWTRKIRQRPARHLARPQHRAARARRLSRAHRSGLRRARLAAELRRTQTVSPGARAPRGAAAARRRAALARSLRSPLPHHHEGAGAQAVPIVTALGVGAHLEAMGIAPERITELDWEESVEVGGPSPHRHAFAALLGARRRAIATRRCGRRG